LPTAANLPAEAALKTVPTDLPPAPVSETPVDSPKPPAADIPNSTEPKP